MTSSLDGRVALVTGASRGIGRHLATALAARGAHVVTSARGAADLDALAEEIGERNGQATAMVCDVGDPGQIRSMFAEISERFGRLDVLVNNAGLLLSESAIEGTLDTVQRTLDVNLRGAMLCAHEAARLMVPARRGSIINIASIFGSVGVPDHTAYAASKAGLEGLTRALAIELAPASVRVNAVAPGYILTDLNQDALADEHIRRKVERAVPLGRIGSPADLEPWVLLLASDASSYVTGSTVTVDGGFVAR